MSLLGDVAVATCSPRHNARQVILEEVSLRPLEDGEGFLILMLGSQGHSECRVILMMILMGSNGGREVSAQTSPSLIKITLEARTLMQRHTHTHTHIHTHARMEQKMDTHKKKLLLWAYCMSTHKHSSPDVFIIVKMETKPDHKSKFSGERKKIYVIPNNYLCQNCWHHVRMWSCYVCINNEQLCDSSLNSRLSSIVNTVIHLPTGLLFTFL